MVYIVYARVGFANKTHIEYNTFNTFININLKNKCQVTWVQFFNESNVFKLYL